MQKILIELILTNRCNKRCNYCDLDFKNKSLSFQDIDLFFEFVKNNIAEYSINFFWGEPLLEFEKLKYFVDNSKEYIKNFSIWTNWILLDKEKLEYFKKNDIKIYLSVDNVSLWKDLDFKLISNYKENITINFINDPDYFQNSIATYKNIYEYWFKKIAFMPVFSTKKRDKIKLIKLKKIYDFIFKNAFWIDLKVFTYFNWISIDRQFVLDTDLYFYSDIDSLLWLQKQYSNIDKYLKQEIDLNTRLLSLTDKCISLKNLINLYNSEKIIRLIFKIPKKSWDFLNYILINKLLKNVK